MTLLGDEQCQVLANSGIVLDNQDHAGAENALGRPVFLGLRRRNGLRRHFARQGCDLDGEDRALPGVRAKALTR